MVANKLVIWIGQKAILASLRLAVFEAYFYGQLICHCFDKRRQSAVRIFLEFILLQLICMNSLYKKMKIAENMIWAKNWKTSTETISEVGKK